MAIDAIVEKLEGVDIGVSAADAENVELLYQFGDLLLRYRDWEEQECEKKFFDVLAFRWEEFTNQAPATIPRLRLSIRHGSPFRLKRKKSSRATTSIIEFASMAMAFSTSLRRDFSAKATFGLLRKA